MGRKNITVSVDSMAADKARHMNLNVSDICDKAIRAAIGLQAQDIKGLNRQQVQAEADKLRDIMIETQQKLASKEAVLAELDEVIQQKQAEQLEQVKKEAETAQTCINCKQIMGKKVKLHQFPAGLVCNTCLQTADKGDRQFWFNKR